MRLISYNQLKLKFGDGFYSRDHLRRKCKADEFPKPISLSEKRIAWDEAEVDDWLAAKASERDEKAA